MIYKVVNTSTLEIVNTYSAEEPISLGNGYANCVHVAMPDGMNPDKVVVVLNEDGTLSLVEKEIELSPLEKELKKISLEDKADDAVYGEMKRILGSDDISFILLENETFKSMKASPAFYSNKGLIADKNVGSFKKGDALDTDVKITGWAGSNLGIFSEFLVARSKIVAKMKEDLKDLE